jgi:predicted permease
VDYPEHDGDNDFAKLAEDDFAELEKIEKESPTSDARLRIEKEGMTVDLSVPSSQTSYLLAALLVVAVVVAPTVTLKALPEGLLGWMVFSIIGLQLGIVGLVAVLFSSANKPATPNRLSS